MKKYIDSVEIDERMKALVLITLKVNLVLNLNVCL